MKSKQKCTTDNICIPNYDYFEHQFQDILLKCKKIYIHFYVNIYKIQGRDLYRVPRKIYDNRLQKLP